MLSFFSSKSQEVALAEALEGAFTVVECSMNGTITRVNKKFEAVIGREAEELVGTNYLRLFASNAAASELWGALNQGAMNHQGVFSFVTKKNVDIWLRSIYLVLKISGENRIIHLGVDITEQKNKDDEIKDMFSAINRFQSTIEFDLDGTIRHANEVFLKIVGYGLGEIKNKHHSMFVPANHRASLAYHEFWENLRKGKYQEGSFRRVGKGGVEVLMSAVYIPVYSAKGKPYKVIKYVTKVELDDTISQREQQLMVIEKEVNEIEKHISEAVIQTDHVVCASNQTAMTFQDVASQAEKMNGAVGESAQTMIECRKSSDMAFEHVSSVDQAAQQLATAAKSMGGIVELIRNIADQINLLALNATIESARAGEEGRGFAVVAAQVKNLAGQASRATEDISKEIKRTQSISSDVAGSLEKIRETIALVRENVGLSATSISDQRNISQAMLSNMQSAAISMSNISNEIAQIAQTTKSVDKSTKTIAKASQCIVDKKEQKSDQSSHHA